MEIPSFKFGVKIGMALAAIQELKVDRNYTALGKVSFDKLDFIESVLREIAEAGYTKVSDENSDPAKIYKCFECGKDVDYTGVDTTLLEGGVGVAKPICEDCSL